MHLIKQGQNDLNSAFTSGSEHLLLILIRDSDLAFERTHNFLCGHLT